MTYYIKHCIKNCIVGVGTAVVTVVVVTAVGSIVFITIASHTAVITAVEILYIARNLIMSPVYFYRKRKLQKCVKKWVATLSTEDKKHVMDYIGGSITEYRLRSLVRLPVRLYNGFYYIQIKYGHIDDEVVMLRSKYKFIPIYFCRKLCSILNLIPSEEDVLSDLNTMLVNIKNEPQEIINMTYLKQLLIEDQRICAICLDELTNKELKSEQVTITRCMHCYHEQCIDLVYDEKCPKCRRYLEKVIHKIGFV